MSKSGQTCKGRKGKFQREEARRKHVVGKAEAHTVQGSMSSGRNGTEYLKGNNRPEWKVLYYGSIRCQEQEPGTKSGSPKTEFWLK